MARIILAAGGTGGHLFTALSVESELQERGHETILICDDRVLKYISNRNSPSNTIIIKSSTIIGKNFFSKIHAMGVIVLSILKMIPKLISIKPDLVIGFGGYPTLPPLMGAFLLRYQVVIHEQNAILGRANRLFEWIGKSRKTVYYGNSSLTLQADKNSKFHTFVGNPVRRDFIVQGQKTYQDRINKDKLVIVVLGGSQGAAYFDSLLTDSIAKLKHVEGIEIIQQCRKGSKQKLNDIYKKLGIKATIQHFFEKPHKLIAKAGLVISRAGASTIAELSTVGVPTVFVPYETSTSKEQKKNIQHLQLEKACFVIDTLDENGSQKLSEIISLVRAEPQKLIEMAKKMKKFSSKRAAINFVGALEKVHLSD